MTEPKNENTKTSSILLISAVTVLIIAVLGGGYWFFFLRPGAQNFWVKQGSSFLGQTSIVTMYSGGKPVRAWKVLHGHVTEDAGAGFDFACNGKSVKVSGDSVSEPLDEAPQLPNDVPVATCK